MNRRRKAEKYRDKEKGRQEERSSASPVTSIFSVRQATKKVSGVDAHCKLPDGFEPARMGGER